MVTKEVKSWSPPKFFSLHNNFTNSGNTGPEETASFGRLLTTI